MGDTMKKTEFVTFRTDEETKLSLESIASENKWSTSQVVEQIVQDWLKEHNDEENIK